METRCQEHFTSTMFDTVEERWYCVRCLLLQVGELQKDMAQAMRIVEEYTYEDLAGIQSELMTKYKKPKGEVCNRCMDNFRRPSSDEGYVCDTCLAKEAKAVAGKRNHEGPPTPTDGSHRAGFRMGFPDDDKRKDEGKH